MSHESQPLMTFSIVRVLCYLPSLGRGQSDTLFGTILCLECLYPMLRLLLPLPLQCHYERRGNLISLLGAKAGTISGFARRPEGGML